MENKKSQLDEVRCINKSGKVRFFRRYFAMDKNWQRATGFTPEELPKVDFAKEDASVKLSTMHPLHDTSENEYTGTIVDGVVPEFSIDFNMSEGDDTDLSESKAPKPQPQTTAKANSQAAKQKEK